MLKEDPELVGTPDPHLGRLALGRIGRLGDVADQIAPPDRVLERPMQDVVDVTDGLGRQALAILASLGQQMAVEGVELGRGEALQLDRPAGREDVCLDVNAVILPQVPGRRFATCTAGNHSSTTKLRTVRLDGSTNVPSCTAAIASFSAAWHSRLVRKPPLVR
jgi:hypothetical protein